jgi:hypothetical protein
VREPRQRVRGVDHIAVRFDLSYAGADRAQGLGPPLVPNHGNRAAGAVQYALRGRPEHLVPAGTDHQQANASSLGRLLQRACCYKAVDHPALEGNATRA